MNFDPFLLSRIQFAANITFHIFFPSITIALAWILLFFKVRYIQTKDEGWIQSYFFFTKVFALSFAIGIVSGLTMSFQFGTNWPGFMKTVGNIAGPLLAYEVLTAFFLEASFLGIMLFGYRRVPPYLHTLATLLVALGTTLSAFWILALNSWMQTPAGFEMIAGKAHATDWYQIVFNPSTVVRLCHMLLASALSASFLVAGLSAYRYLHGDRSSSLMKSLKTVLIVAAVAMPMQSFVGDQHGLIVKDHQPAKLAAIEALWDTEKNVPLVLFAWPNEKEKRNDFEISIPSLGSLILTHSWDGEVKGLNDFEFRPPVAPIFFAFRIMVGLGVLMWVVSWMGVYFLVRGQTLPRYYVYTLIAMTFAGCFATIAGWYVTEIGRQPWLVQDVLLTKDALGAVPGRYVFTTLLIYLGVYVFLAIAYVSVIFYMAKKAAFANKVGDVSDEMPSYR